VRLVAPGPGTVEKVILAAGSDAKPGEPVVTLNEPRLTGQFKMPAADATALKPGQAVSLQPTAGGAPLGGRIGKIAGGTAIVEFGDGAAKVGDSVRLVRARVPNIVPVPAAALVKRDGADVVYVFADGAVHERKVNVVDRSGGEVLVGSGLARGDQVVSAGADALHDGQKASQ
jgi:hypothetical protein